MPEADSLKFPNRNGAYVERHLEFPVSRRRKFRGFDTRQPHVAARKTKGKWRNARKNLDRALTMHFGLRPRAIVGDPSFSERRI